MVNEFTEEESIEVRIQGHAGGRGGAPFHTPTPPPHGNVSCLF